MSLLPRLFNEQLSGIYFSDLIAIILISALLTLLWWYVKNKVLRKRDAFRIFFMLFYIQFIVLVTILRREPGAGMQAGSIVPYIEFGSINGDIYTKKQMIYTLFNVILFIPLGISLGLSWAGSSSVKNIFLPVMTGFLFSFAIEITQLVTRRGVFELTDIFTNVFGTVIGVLVVWGVRKGKGK